MKLTFQKPSKTDPGFLRRQRSVLEMRSKLQGQLEPGSVDTLVEFLLPYITEPVDRDQAREALWDASQDQFDEMLQALTGSGNPT